MTQTVRHPVQTWNDMSFGGKVGTSTIAGVTVTAVAAATLMGVSGAYLTAVVPVHLGGVYPTVHGTVTDMAGNPASGTQFVVAPGVPQQAKYKVHATGSLKAHTYLVFDPNALHDGSDQGLNTTGTYTQDFTVKFNGDVLFNTTNANDFPSCPPGSYTTTHPEPCKAIRGVIDLGLLNSNATGTLEIDYTYASKATGQSANPTPWNTYKGLNKAGQVVTRDGLNFNVDFDQEQAPPASAYIPED